MTATLMPLTLMWRVIVLFGEVSRAEIQGQGHGQVNSNQPIGVLVSQLIGDERAPISPAGGEFPVPQYRLHQLDPQIRGAPVVHSGHRQRTRKTEPRQRRHYYIEAVMRIGAKSCRIGERPNYFFIVPERPRPTVT